MDPCTLVTLGVLTGAGYVVRAVVRHLDSDDSRYGTSGAHRQDRQQVRQIGEQARLHMNQASRQISTRVEQSTRRYR